MNSCRLWAGSVDAVVSWVAPDCGSVAGQCDASCQCARPQSLGVMGVGVGD